jgi:hypothetical protein
VGTTLFDSIGQSTANPTGMTYFGEREAIKLAFDAAGSTVLSEPAAHQSLATAQPLILTGVAVPNTLQPGDLNYGQTFSVAAVDVVGFLNPGNQNQNVKATDDYYSFVGSAGDLMNFELMSQALTRNTQPFDTVLYVYDASGNLLISSDDAIETHDSRIFDYTLPYTGLLRQGGQLHPGRHRRLHRRQLRAVHVPLCHRTQYRPGQHPGRRQRQ